MKIGFNMWPTFSAGILLAMSSIAFAQDEAPEQTLFKNVNVFDGKSEELVMGVTVLIEGNVIKRITVDSLNAPGATEIDGAGRTERLDVGGSRQVAELFVQAGLDR